MKVIYVISEVDGNTYIALFTDEIKAENYRDDMFEKHGLDIVCDICDDVDLIDTGKEIHIK